MDQATTRRSPCGEATRGETQAQLDEARPLGPTPAADRSAAQAAPQRRRGKALEQAIFQATLEQLTSEGFARMTMEGVAGAAQTGKAALYRRWPSKMDLVLDALEFTLSPPTDTPDLGSVRSELMQLMATFGDAMDSPAGAALQVLMAELDHERGRLVKDFVMSRVMEPAQIALLAILRRGEQRGDVRAGTATPLIADVALAMLLYRAKFDQHPPTSEFRAQLVDDVLLPLVRP